MKTKSVISAKMIVLTTLGFMYLTFFSCTGKETTSDDNQLKVSESKPQPPVTDIYAASLMGNVAAVKQHIAAGTDINKKDAYGATPLVIASTFGKTEVAKVLIEAGADMHITNNEGSTPLHIASFFCHKEIVEALLTNGADKSLRNNSGSTALESVSAPFSEVVGIYDYISKELGPLGFKLDYEHVKKTRPVIAEMLQQ